MRGEGLGVEWLMKGLRVCVCVRDREPEEEEEKMAKR